MGLHIQGFIYNRFIFHSSFHMGQVWHWCAHVQLMDWRSLLYMSALLLSFPFNICNICHSKVHPTKSFSVYRKLSSIDLLYSTATRSIRVRVIEHPLIPCYPYCAELNREEETVAIYIPFAFFPLTNILPLVIEFINGVWNHPLS